MGLISYHTSLVDVQSVILSVLVELQPSATYCVQRRRGYDLPSIRVCLSAIFCQAQTMQQNNPVKCAVHNKQAIMGRMA